MNKENCALKLVDEIILINIKYRNLFLSYGKLKREVREIKNKYKLRRFCHADSLSAGKPETRMICKLRRCETRLLKRAGLILVQR